LAQSARSLLALITLALPAAAQTFPALSGRVVLPKAKVRQGRWQWLNYVDPPKTGRWASSHSAWAASSSSSSGLLEQLLGRRRLVRRRRRVGKLVNVTQPVRLREPRMRIPRPLQIFIIGL
jgi:hypothetical protein